MGAEGPPENAGLGEAGASLRKTMRREPGLQRRAERLARRPAVGLVGEIDAVLRLDRGEAVGKPGGLAERPDMARRHHHQHDPAAVAGREIAAEGAVHVVADARPLGAVISTSPI